MRTFFIISILLSLQLFAKTQMVLGTFSKQSNCDFVQEKINKIINNDLEFKKLLEKNNIKLVKKKDSKYFLVTLEPFENKKIIDAVRKKMKTTKYTDFYVTALKQKKYNILKKAPPKVQKPKTIQKEKAVIKEKPVVKEEPIVKTKPAIETKPIQKKHIVVEAKKITQTKPIPPKEENIVQKYLIEIIAIISIMILVVVYLFMVRNKQKRNHTLEIEKEEEIIEDVFDSPVVEDFYIEPTEIKEDTQYLRSSVEKKEVPLHAKITKEDFKVFQNNRIIIAEDNLINQKVIKGLLSNSGIELHIVDDGQEVLDLLEKDDAFSVILMDVHMPNMNGYEATKIIRSNPKYSHITVVALSGDIAPDDVSKMRSAGMQENLEKPLKMDSLYDILAAYTDQDNAPVDPDQNQKNHLKTNILDIDTGLEVCGGDESFYKEILKDFLNNYEDSSTQIQTLLDEKEFESAQKIILDIMGVTSNIGAKEIQEVMKELKQSLMNPEKEEYKQLFRSYSQHFKMLQGEVKKYIS